MSQPPARSGTKPDPIAAFLGDLVEQGHQPLLHNVSGTIRLDLLDPSGPEHWFISVREGTVAVSNRNAKADAVGRAEEKLIAGMAKGSVNVNAALLRGDIEIEGDLALISSFARLFPGPARSKTTFLERQKEAAG